MADANAAAANANRAAANANAAVANAANAPPSDDHGKAISQEMKEQIRRQVDEAIQAHKLEQAVPLPTLLDPKRVFLVDRFRSVLAADGKPCSLDEGDLMQLESVPGPQDRSAKLIVVSSKGEEGSCLAGARIQLAISTLLEMQEKFTERVGQGMEKMKEEKINR